jgi:hypothetical protein
MPRLAFLRRPWPSRSAWLLWIALLLPLAQLATVAHAFLHQPQEATVAANDKQGPAGAHCDLCVLSAVVGAGGAASSPPQAALLPLAQAAPVHIAADPALAAPASPYRSRAPPDSLA